MTSAAGFHRTRRPPMALVATALLAAPGAAFTASSLPFRHQQPSSRRRLQQRAWEQSSRPVCGVPVLAAEGKGGKEGEAAAPAIDIETVSSELLVVQEEAEKEMKAAATLQELEDLRRK
ncbi:unnamed protein product, partial [Ectocarpus sp. 12 AP-2014]